MSRSITLKLTKASPTVGPFNITTDHGVVLGVDVPKKTLISGIMFTVDINVQSIILESNGRCKSKIKIVLQDFFTNDFISSTFKQSVTGCLWRHLTNIQLYNSYYGNTEPYVIEYPFAYQYQDEILQNVKDYTKAYEYVSIPDGVYNDNVRIETNNKWFNKAILYNGQQSSGILELVAKPMHNLQAYNQYPIFNTESKTITYTKSDNFYQYNTFWALQVSSQIPLFYTGCQSLSVDKVINQTNMDYTTKSFKKSPLRAKELKVRHILDNRSDIHLVSQFILGVAQISYK